MAQKYTQVKSTVKQLETEKQELHKKIEQLEKDLHSFKYTRKQLTSTNEELTLKTRKSD